MKKFILRICLPVLVILFAFNVSAQNTVYVLNYYKANYIFSSGFWVYQDTATLETDSITLENVKHGFYGPNPVILDYREYYQMEYYSHTNDSAFNDFFLENLWRVNGGGEWAELGQPVMLANYYGPLLGGYNGFEILNVMDSLAVGSNTFYNVAWSHVYENQQYQHEFNFDTDLYYVEDVGLVRKAYTDDNGVGHSWDLVNWAAGSPVGVSESSDFPEIPSLFPNPTPGHMKIISKDPVWLELCSLQGEMLLESTGSEMDISNLADGIYLLRIYTADRKFLRAEKIIKLSK